MNMKVKFLQSINALIIQCGNLPCDHLVFYDQLCVITNTFIQTKTQKILNDFIILKTP